MEKIPEVIREYVWKRDRGKCRICGAPADDVHHVFGRETCIPEHLDVPWIKKNHHPVNLICVCRKCHLRLHASATRELKERIIKTNQELSCIHFDDELEKKMKKALEELTVEEVKT